MLGFACCLASSSQLARWLKVSRLRGSDVGLLWEHAARGCGHVNALGIRRTRPETAMARRGARRPARRGSQHRRGAPGDVIDQQCTGCSAVVGARDRSERLLTGLQTAWAL